MYLSAEAHEWILASQYRGPLSEATDWLAPFENPLNQHQVFDMNSRAIQLLHFNIELTVVFPSNVDAMLF